MLGGSNSVALSLPDPVTYIGTSFQARAAVSVYEYSRELQENVHFPAEHRPPDVQLADVAQSASSVPLPAGAAPLPRTGVQCFVLEPDPG